jgi:hypothetical protein
MSIWKIKIFASDRPDDPTHIEAKHGEYEFNVLSMIPLDKAVKDPSRKADGSLENNIPQRTTYEVELLPFYIKNELVPGQMDYNDMVLFKKMIRQPYLVIKACTLPAWNDGSNNWNNEYPLPAVVRWNFEETMNNNKEKGILELTIQLEAIYTKGTTQPTPITNTEEYTY